MSFSAQGLIILPPMTVRPGTALGVYLAYARSTQTCFLEKSWVNVSLVDVGLLLSPVARRKPISIWSSSMVLTKPNRRRNRARFRSMFSAPLVLPQL